MKKKINAEKFVQKIIKLMKQDGSYDNAIELLKKPPDQVTWLKKLEQ